MVFFCMFYNKKEKGHNNDLQIITQNIKDRATQKSGVESGAPKPSSAADSKTTQARLRFI